MVDPVIHAILAYALALLFAAGVLHKLRAPKAFRGVLAAYDLLPAALLTPAAALIILFELGVAVMLLTPALRTSGAIAAAVLLSGYALAIAVNLARGQRDIDCGCSGFGARQTLSPWLVVRNLVLIATGAAIAAPTTARALTWWDAGLIFLGTLALALLYSATQQLIANQPRLAALRARRA